MNLRAPASVPVSAPTRIMIPLQPAPRHRTGPELQLRHRAHREHQPNSALTIDTPARPGLCPRHHALARSSPALPQPHSATIHLPRPTTFSTRHTTCPRLRRRRITYTRPRPRTRTIAIAANTTRTPRLFTSQHLGCVATRSQAPSSVAPMAPRPKTAAASSRLCAATSQRPCPPLALQWRYRRQSVPG